MKWGIFDLFWSNADAVKMRYEVEEIEFAFFRLDFWPDFSAAMHLFMPQTRASHMRRIRNE